MGELWFRIRDFFKYTKLERRDLILSIIIITFVFAYDDKREEFNLIYWAGHFLLTFLIVALAFLVHTGTQKVFALQQGFIAEYRAWPLGLAISAMFALITGGKWYVLLPGAIYLIHVPILRLGKWRYGTNIVAQGMVAASGAIGNLIFATFALAIGAQLGFLPELFLWVATINFWILIFSLMPLPRMDGLHLFFMSRLAYIFIVSTLLAYVIFAQLKFYSWIAAFIVGVICWLLFYLYYEKA
jgi:Zn-dependent protease